jgi:hypothetical protein
MTHRRGRLALLYNAAAAPTLREAALEHPGSRTPVAACRLDDRRHELTLDRAATSTVSGTTDIASDGAAAAAPTLRRQRATRAHHCLDTRRTLGPLNAVARLHR